MSVYCKYAAEAVHLSGTLVVELATDDEVQLIVTSDYNGLKVSFKTFNCTISEFFD